MLAICLLIYELIFCLCLNFGGANITLMWGFLIDLQNLGHQHDENLEALPHSDGIDIYNDLADLVNFGGLSEGAGNFFLSYNDCCYPNQSFQDDNALFLELDDLDAPLNGPAEGEISEIIHTDNTEQSSVTINPGLSQCPSMLP